MGWLGVSGWSPNFFPGHRSESKMRVALQIVQTPRSTPFSTVTIQ
jgi:hypothetical protein